MGRRPLRRERAKLPSRQTLRSRACKTARSCRWKDGRGGEGKFKTSHKDSVEGEPKRSESPGEQTLPIRIKPPDTKRETASRWGQAAGAPASGR